MATLFDILLKNGTVVDGTGRPRFVGDIGIKGSKIAAVGPSLSGSAARTIDATGRVVAPAWVDIHSHVDAALFWDK